LRSSVLSFAQRLLFGVGLVTLAYAGGMVAYAKIYQRYQDRMFERKLDVRKFENTAAATTAVDAPEGGLVGRLEIPRIGTSVMVLEGVESNTLRNAAGHIPGTAPPGGDGNAAIAAHRDTFFRNLRGIRSGDRIQVSTLRGTYAYTVESTEIVGPQDIPVLESKGYPELTLITCYPFYLIGPAPKRFIVHALSSGAHLTIDPSAGAR
jgi:sortase A